MPCHHPLRSQKPAAGKGTTSECSPVPQRCALLGFLLLLKLLDLPPLAFDFLLLLIYLALRLSLLVFLILHRVAYREAADTA